VELLIVIVIVTILASASAVIFGRIQLQVARSAIDSDLRQAYTVVESYAIQHGSTAPPPEYLTEVFTPSPDIILTLHQGGEDEVLSYYTGLSPVQNGVLLQGICEALVDEPVYSQIHSLDGKSTQTAQLACDDNISANSLLITGWDSKTWKTPLQKTALTNYIASVPYDSWWIDRQEVVRGFYQTLIDRFEARGGTWPITSFWDPWANQFSGVGFEPLPPFSIIPSPHANDPHYYCIEAVHVDHDDMLYHLSSDDPSVKPGACT
jgi:type II secretory pathway pseudopilin PulG